MPFDVIIVGGGLAGATLTGALAREGHSVLVLEQETLFKDRVRGENMLPWGVAAARRLKIVDRLIAAGGHQPRYWTTYLSGNPVERRELPATTPLRESALNIYHPDMQEALLEHAAELGAVVKRGVRVTGLDVRPGQLRGVVFEDEGRRQQEDARVVVGADGKGSQMRAWGGFEVRRNPEVLTIAGMLIQDTDVPVDSIHLTFSPGSASLVAPLGGGWTRMYFVYRGVDGRRGLSGNDNAGRFMELCLSAGVHKSWLANAKSSGPLAEFDGADRWVDSPARNGIVLIGDAAAASDPSWGCGLSLTLMDVEHLANALCESSDWNAALQHYASQHDEYYHALHRILGWMTELMWSVGPAADERRGRVLPRMLADPRGYPDVVGQGPLGPSDERAGKLILGIA